MSDQCKEREYKYEWDVLYIRCTQCGKWGTIDDFPRDKSKKFWTRSNCKICEVWRRKIVHDKWYEKHKDEAKENMKEYHKLNKDKINRRMQNKVDAHTNSLWFDRYSFHAKTRYYAKIHNLKPHRCPICWSEDNIQMHHPSYDTFDKWSEVVFCCKWCHSKIHSWEIKNMRIINLLEIGEQLAK
jgi:hypothetical protein